MIGFNKPFFTGREIEYIRDAVEREKLSGNGYYTQRVQKFFESQYAFRKVLLTQSCTDALEMASLLIGLKPGDEVILPSFTFVSTANAFALRGARLVFADSCTESPNIDPAHIQQLITPKTRAIVVVHYAGVACDMEPIMKLAKEKNILVVEDAAQAIDSYWQKKPLGSLGHFGCFSFHETKNVISGEGGMLTVNDEQFISRAEIIWEKGTNRSAFFRGEVDKYSWMDIGSSFLPSEITAAFLWAQVKEIETIQMKRSNVWKRYFEGLQGQVKKGNLVLPSIPSYATNNAHMFYVICTNGKKRDDLMAFLQSKQIQAIFHYLPLHSSPYFKSGYSGKELVNANRFSECILRLPFYTELKMDDVDTVINSINQFYNS